MTPTLGIKGRLVLLFTLLFGVAVGAMALASFAFQRDFLVEETAKRGQLLAKSLMMSVRDPLLNRDLLSLASALEAVRQEPDVVSAWVLDHRGAVVMRSDAARPGLQTAGLSSLPTAPLLDHVLTFSAPVTYGPRAIGSVHIGLGMAQADVALGRTRRHVVRTMFVGLVIGMAGSFALAWFFVKPVNLLVRATREAAKGKLDVQVPVRRRDELGALAESFNTMIADLRTAAVDIQQGYLDMTIALAAAIEAKDQYTRGHCQRVSAYSVEIGTRLALPDPAMRDLELAAILHDIGKIGIDEAILTKPTRLTFDEMQVMHEHPVIGERILQSVEPLRLVASYIVHHHEHYDGKGYPHGARGDEIPLIARIISVADAYDSMSSRRPYREPLSDAESVRRLRATAGSQFDPHVVAIFLELHEMGVIERIKRATDA
ncbi:MAG: HD domain-containing protein [Nitrospirae bacterium]|nr:HD domain-containing protein [Nitrospirota bacterium]